MTKKKTQKNDWPKLILKLFGIMAWVGISIVASQFVIGYLIIWIMGTGAFDRPEVTAVFSALSYLLALFLIVYIPPMVRRANEKKPSKNKKLVTKEELGFKSLPTWTDIGLAVVGFIVYLGIAMLITMLFQLFPWFNASEAQETGFSTYLVGFDRLIAFFTLVIIAPIAEEIIFRGWLYGKLKLNLSTKASNTVSMIVSTILVSLLFGLIHGQWNVGLNVFSMSLVLCALREITGTIHSGIIMHMLKNGLAFYLLYVAGMGF